MNNNLFSHVHLKAMVMKYELSMEDDIMPGGIVG